MSSKTKIVVLHMKEVVYTAIFLVLAVLLLVLLFVMFGSHKKADPTAAADTENAEILYAPGVYTSPVSLGDQTFDVQVIVDESRITSISLNNLSETAAAMYPLMEPSLDSLASQIYTSQSTENITFEDENKYTSKLLLTAIQSALDKAKTDS